MKKNYRAIIIGAGPAGLGVATALQQSGIDDFIILDREQAPGGVPRHCYHPTFGIKTCFFPVSGPAYIQKILASVDQRKIITRATVIAIKEKGVIVISTHSGVHELQGERVILATGARETPRHPRLISGLRPLAGIMTTGALQQFVYLNKKPPPRYPVIIGSEAVSFSALWTLHQAGVKTLAMVEASSRPGVWRMASFISALWRTPIYYHSVVNNIGGLECVEYVDLKDTLTGDIQRLPCNAVIFTGKFVGETTLLYHSHLQQDGTFGYPITDQYGRCSDEVYFAAGNLLHPVDTGENCYLQGKKVGNSVAASLTADLPMVVNRLTIQVDPAYSQFVFPGAIALPMQSQTITLQLRTANVFVGKIALTLDNEVVRFVSKSCYAQQNILLKNIRLPADLAAGSLLRLEMMPS